MSKAQRPTVAAIVVLACLGFPLSHAVSTANGNGAPRAQERPFELYFLVGEIPVWMGNTIRYTVYETTQVEARFLTPAGEIIMILPEGERAPGQYTLPWDGTVDGAQFAGFYTFELYFGDEYAAKSSIVVNPIAASS